MKLEEIELIPLSRKKIIVKEMCALYKKLKLLEINKKNGRTLMDENKIGDKKYDILRSYSVFEGILELLDNNQKLIIRNEFLETKRKD